MALPWHLWEAEAGHTRVAICFPLHGPFLTYAELGMGPGGQVGRTWQPEPPSKLLGAQSLSLGPLQGKWPIIRLWSGFPGKQDLQ